MDDQSEEDTSCSWYPQTNVVKMFSTHYHFKTLASYDQFSNMILQDSVERRIVTFQGVCCYHDVPLGTYIVRGDSMVFMGQLNVMKEQMVMREVRLEELEKIEQQEAGQEPLNWDFDADLIA